MSTTTDDVLDDIVKILKKIARRRAMSCAVALAFDICGGMGTASAVNEVAQAGLDLDDIASILTVWRQLVLKHSKSDLEKALAKRDIPGWLIKLLDNAV